MLLQRISLILSILIAAVVGCSDSSESNRVAVQVAEPPPPLLERYELSSEVSFPEGVTFDEQDRAFYAGGSENGSITRVDADGTESLFRAADGRAQLLGIKVDPQARRLWACARLVDGMDNRVWIFDLESGDLAQEFVLGALFGGGDCNDLALDSAGIAYVSDFTNR